MERLKRINPLHERIGYLGVVVLGIVVLLIGLLLRSDIFLTVVGFVLEILGWIGILGGVAIAAAGVAAFGNERGWWDRIVEANSRSGAKMPLARGLSGSALFLLVILFFFLPWMSVSCFGEELLSASGTDIMGITQIDNIPSEIAGDDYGIEDALGSEAVLLYIAVLLAVAGGVLFFLPGRQGSYVRAGTGGRGNRMPDRLRPVVAGLRGVRAWSRHRRTGGCRHWHKLESGLLAVSAGVHRGHRDSVRAAPVRR